MGFFSKKEEEVPEFPRMSSLNQNNIPNQDESVPEEENQEFSDESYELPNPPNHSLPSFPNSNLGERINQNTIKEAVAHNSSEQFSQEPQYNPNSYPSRSRVPQLPPTHYHSSMNQGNYGGEGFRTVESQNYGQESMENFQRGQDFYPSNEQVVPMQNNRLPPTKKQRVETLFIQLDNFEKTIATFDEVKLKISEIESLLKSIKEVKKKEEEKLMSWERELVQIKHNLDEIDRNFFNI